MEVAAADRNGAVAQFKTMMTAGSIKVHMDEKHPGQPLISVADCHAQIEKDVVPA